jgi:hypothetical protein
MAVEQASKNAQADELMKEKEVAKQEMMTQWLNTKDDNERNQLGNTVKLTNIADMLRTYATTQGINKSDVVNMKDAELVGKFLDTEPASQPLFIEYMNGKKDQLSFGREL